MTHHAAGRVREALRLYQRVVELDPGHEKAKEKLPELERDVRHEDAINLAMFEGVDNI